MDKIKIKSIPLDEDLVRKILEILDEYGEGGPLKETSYLGIAEKLSLNLDKKGIFDKLRTYLFYMVEKGLIEERHFDNGKVDYAIENPGIDMLRN